MTAVPTDLKEQLEQYGQEHVLKWWDELTPSQKEQFLEQLRSIDLEQTEKLFEQGESKTSLPPLENLGTVEADQPEPQERALGEEALRGGHVAVLMVSGGQGSRLGFDHAKGMYPIGPVSGCSLFQIHAEKIIALGNRYGHRPLFLIMTSEATDQEIRDYFEQQSYFGLSPDEVVFFSQKSLPATDLNGKLLLERKDRVFTSPNGHGGVLQALHENRVIDRLQQENVQHVFYYQVDNPLVQVADPSFVGQHIANDAEASIKVVSKQRPEEPIGNLVLLNGRCDMIEYTELPAEWAAIREDNDRLKFWAGSIAIHVFSVPFLQRMAESYEDLPYHIAKKNVEHLDENGQQVTPDAKNAFKFERFIFDVLPKARRWSIVVTRHETEFEPLKNAEGENTPETVRRAMVQLARQWLAKAGVEMAPEAEVEISPLYALEPEELSSKKLPRIIVEPTWLKP